MVNVAHRVLRKEEKDLKERRDKNLIIFGISEVDCENTRAVVKKLLQECVTKKLLTLTIFLDLINYTKTIVLVVGLKLDH